MASYYVSTGGSDSYNGTSPVFTSGSNGPWASLAKGVVASSPVTGGDTIYVEPGKYNTQAIFARSGSAGNPITIVGDVDGAGFRAGGVANPKIGPVIMTSYVNDFTGATTFTSPITVYLSSSSYITLRNLYLMGTAQGGGVKGAVLFQPAAGVSCTNWTIQDCVLSTGHDSFTHGGTPLAYYPPVGTGTDPAPINHTIDRCTLISYGSNSVKGNVHYQLHLGTVEIDHNINVRNCQIIGGASGVTIGTIANGSNAALPVGLRVQNCTISHYHSYGVNTYQTTTAPTVSTPVTGGVSNYVYGCFIFGAGYGFATNHSSQVVEDGNYMPCGRHASTVAGDNTRTTGAPFVNPGLERILGLPPRPFLEPLPISTSPLVGGGSYGTPSTYDVHNRRRPDGMGSLYPTIGGMEVHDTGTRDGTYPDGGTGYCLKLGPGPMSQDRYILVNPVTTTISVKVCFDGNHGNATKPQAILLANPEIGVMTTQTVTATGSAGGAGTTPGTYETLSFSPVTPTAAGVLVLRLVGRPAAANGVAYFDTITLS